MDANDEQVVRVGCVEVDQVELCVWEHCIRPNGVLCEAVHVQSFEVVSGAAQLLLCGAIK
eukprot:12791-Heterococcus_DN1.PRE.1